MSFMIIAGGMRDIKETKQMIERKTLTGLVAPFISVLVYEVYSSTSQQKAGGCHHGQRQTGLWVSRYVCRYSEHATANGSGCEGGQMGRL